MLLVLMCARGGQQRNDERLSHRGFTKSNRVEYSSRISILLPTAKSNRVGHSSRIFILLPTAKSNRVVHSSRISIHSFLRLPHRLHHQQQRSRDLSRHTTKQSIELERLSLYHQTQERERATLVVLRLSLQRQRHERPARRRAAAADARRARDIMHRLPSGQQRPRGRHRLAYLRYSNPANSLPRKLPSYLLTRSGCAVVELAGRTSNRGIVSVDAAAVTNLAASRDAFSAITEVPTHTSTPMQPPRTVL